MEPRIGWLPSDDHAIPSRTIGSRLIGAAQVLVGVVFGVLRLTTYAVLATLEPFVSLVCTALTVLSLGCALLNRVALPQHPEAFWGLLILAALSAVTLVVYRSLVLLMSR